MPDVPVLELSAEREVDLVFGRGETPAFRLTFTSFDEATVAGWDITGEIRRAATLEPFADFDVRRDGNAVTFSLTDTVTEALPAVSQYRIRLAYPPNTVRVPMAGRLTPRPTETCP